MKASEEQNREFRSVLFFVEISPAAGVCNLRNTMRDCMS